MESLLAASLIFVFAVLASLHLYWAVGGRRAFFAAIPEVDGALAFVPSRFATLTIATVLAACAAVVAASAGFLAVPVPGTVVRSLAAGLSVVLVMRAIGDFSLFGMFKKVDGTYFAEMDSRVYSPLCLVLAVGAVVATLPPQA
ncbi:MAG TPA: DUF3995 domain-containing protein [Candidatus Limnocylindrales bacterium]|nr:DUF3995 domain-containing protein [Candidatus Limnocylindrales bacterium]